MKALALSFVVTLLFFPAALAQDFEVSFETGRVESMILVRVLANEKPATLILDTGSGQTVLRPELVELASEALPPSSFLEDEPGLWVRGRRSQATLKLGEKVWRRRSVAAMNLDEISRFYGAKVDGLLGQDLLREFDRVTIDFRARKIIFTPRDSEPLRLNAGE